MKVYTDQNRVTWLLLDGGQGKVFGTADPAATMRYDPLQPDTHVDSEARVIAAIDAYAKAHKSEAVLVVSASPDRGGVLLVLAALLLFAMSEK